MWYWQRTDSKADLSLQFTCSETMFGYRSWRCCTRWAARSYDTPQWDIQPNGRIFQEGRWRNNHHQECTVAVFWQAVSAVTYPWKRTSGCQSDMHSWARTVENGIGKDISSQSILYTPSDRHNCPTVERINRGHRPTRGLLSYQLCQ